MEKERLWHLARFDLLRAMRPGDMETFNRGVKEARYRKGETIYLPGDPSNAVYFVKRGRVKLSYRDETGKQLAIGVCGRGEPFGEMAAIGEEERRLAATALDEVWLCWMHRDEFLRFVDAHPGIALRVAKLIGWRRRELENRLQELMFKDVPTRLARTLLRLAGRYGREVDGGIQIQVRLTHHDLGELIGATRETTTAALNRFKREGMTERIRGRILITAPERLRHLAGEK